MYHYCFVTFLNRPIWNCQVVFLYLTKLLIILPHSELRKLRRQTMRIERGPIHHLRGIAPTAGGIASHLSSVKVVSIPIAVSRSFYDRNNLSNSWGIQEPTNSNNRRDYNAATNHLACEREAPDRWIYRFRLKNPTADDRNYLFYFIDTWKPATRCPNDSPRASSQSDRLIYIILRI